MRQVLVVASLALLPVLAHAQVSTPSANLQANATVQPISFVRPAVAAAVAPAPAPAPNSHIVRPAHEYIQADVDPSFTEAALRQGGTLSYTMNGSNQSVEPASPVLVHVVGTLVPLDQASTDSDVKVHLTVDAQGIPHNLVIAKSAGAELDAKTLEAVNQYRFKPAMFNNRPVSANVTVEIKTQNQK